MSTLRYWYADNVDVDAPVASITVAGLAPTPVVSVAPPVVNVTVTGLAPTVNTSDAVAPSVANITVTGLAPTPSVSVAAPVADITLAGVAPTPSVSVTPPSQSIVIQGVPPNIGGSNTVLAETGHITVEGLAPEVSAISPGAPVNEGGAVSRRKPKLTLDSTVRVDRQGQVWVVALAPQVDIESTYEEELALLTFV